LKLKEFGIDDKPVQISAPSNEVKKIELTSAKDVIKTITTITKKEDQNGN
jgi:hypothetical protein